MINKIIYLNHFEDETRNTMIEFMKRLGWLLEEVSYGKYLVTPPAEDFLHEND